MIEMKCPACGAGGRVSKDKINTRLVCRKCMRVFHLTSGGRTVLGEPPQAAVSAARPPREKVEFDYSLDVPPWLGRVTRLVFAPKVLTIAGGLILVACIGIAVSILRGESLKERTTKVARAAVMGDLGTLIELTATGTGDDMLKWYSKVRPQCEELKGALQTQTPFVEVIVSKEDTSNGTASVLARIGTAESPARTGGGISGAASQSLLANKTMELPLELTSEGMSGWRLDGKRTLEAIPKKL
jgi:hypothetical protein